MTKSQQQIVFSPGQTIALIIGGFTVGFPSFLYWQLGSMLFGQHPLVKVLVISGIGGMISFALYAGRKWWPLAGVIGIFGGLGAAGLVWLYTIAFHRERMWTSEFAMVAVLGAAPAMALFAFFVRRYRVR